MDVGRKGLVRAAGSHEWTRPGAPASLHGAHPRNTEVSLSTIHDEAAPAGLSPLPGRGLDREERFPAHDQPTELPCEHHDRQTEPTLGSVGSVSVPNLRMRPRVFLVLAGSVNATRAVVRPSVIWF